MVAKSKTLEITPEVVREDGVNRIARSSGQFSAAGATVVVGVWLASALGWDGEVPPDVRTALEVLLAIGVAWWTNRHRLRGDV